MFAPRKWLCLLAPKRPPTGVESRAKLLNRCTWLKFSDFDLCSPRSGQGQPIFARCTMDPLPMLLFIVPPVLLMHQTTPRVYSSDWLVLARNWLSIGDAILPPQILSKAPSCWKKMKKWTGNLRFHLEEWFFLYKKKRRKGLFLGSRLPCGSGSGFQLNHPPWLEFWKTTWLRLTENLFHPGSGNGHPTNWIGFPCQPLK